MVTTLAEIHQVRSPSEVWIALMAHPHQALDEKELGLAWV